jgi:hypothetical protein
MSTTLNRDEVVLEKIRTITLAPNEVLIVKLSKGASREALSTWVSKLKACLNT